MKRVLLVLCVSATLVTSSASELDPLSDEYIHSINSRQSSWKSKKILPRDAPLFIKRGKRSIDKELFNLPKKEYDPEFIKSLPESFDPRDKWPACESLNEIREQGACISDWALAPAAMMTDRYCIASNGTKKFHFSGEYIITCHTNNTGGNCFGGYIASALNTWNTTGVVSGGNYGSNEGCIPYSTKPCDNVHENATDHCPEIFSTPKCKKTCQESYNVSLKDDLKYGSEAYVIHGEDNIKAELVSQGPVVGFLLYFHDFLNYTSGIYRHSGPNYEGEVFVKIIGYGEENYTKYWLVANSWTKSWGEKGFFKMIRGDDASETFENYLLAANVYL